MVDNFDFSYLRFDRFIIAVFFSLFSYGKHSYFVALFLLGWSALAVLFRFVIVFFQFHCTGFIYCLTVFR